jgi:hypothetical protein
VFPRSPPTDETRPERALSLGVELHVNDHSAPPTAAKPARVYTRNFRSRQTLSLVLATWLTMLGVGLLSSIGLAPLIAVPLLLLYVVAVICVLAGHDVITLTADGFAREWTPLAARVLPLRTHTTFIPFAAVRSYKVDSEMSRALKSYDYLEIDLAQDPHRLIATNRHDRAGFEEFKRAFLERVSGVARTVPGTLSPDSALGGACSDPSVARSATDGSLRAPPSAESGDRVPGTVRATPIRERRSFYASPLAIVVALVFGAAAIVLTGAALLGHLSFGSLVRLMLVILPGTGYILWRVAKARTPRAE